MRVAILGSSKIALDHAKIVKTKGDDIPFVIVRNINTERTKFFQSLFPKTSFLKYSPEILTNLDVDLFISCVSLNSADSLFEVFTNVDVPVLFEKPAFLREESRVLLSQLSKERISTMFVGFNRRFYKTVLLFQNALIKEKLAYTETRISENLLIANKRIIDYRQGDFLLYSSASHILDLLIFLFGPLSITSESYSAQKENAIIKRIICVDRNQIEHHILIADRFPLKVGISAFSESRKIFSLSPIEHFFCNDEYLVKKPEENQEYVRYEIAERDSLWEQSPFRPGLFGQYEEFRLLETRRICSIAEYGAFWDFVSQMRRTSIHQ